VKLGERPISPRRPPVDSRDEQREVDEELAFHLEE
jgi:hypothetical protein